MTTFIFQGNPDRFDIDGYLARQRERINWLMTSSYKEIRPGDQVFIWRARGSKGDYESAGIVAECFVESPATKMPDDPNGIQFWREKPDGSITYRVWLKVMRVAANGTLLDQERIKNRKGISRIGPLGYRSGTNYKLTPLQGEELNKLWVEFVDEDNLERSKYRFESEVAVLEKLPLTDLLEKYNRNAVTGLGNPLRIQITTSIFQRDPLVKAISRVRAGFRCEVPHCRTPSFPSFSGEPYCEVHHLLRLADGGKDTIDNVVCVCANHHRELHVGRARGELTALLRSIRS